ncbi:hypothetical protein ACIBCH_41940 [Amycolatopsis thailandensis]|uniref:hypothetical protein n=1 Tax=Amycolatopsis thailandensis TaxID=589330 RepID=UPI003799A7DD
MTTTTTYLDDLSRVRIAFTGLSADADYALVERSTDGITWTTVRGGDKVGLVSSAGKLDDYEFVAGVANTYRVTAVDAATPQWIGSGGPVTAVNASLTPFTNGSTVAGDLLLMLATIRNSGAGAPVQPAGWTTVVDLGNVKLFARYAAAGGSTGHTVTFTGGVAGADTTAQLSTFRNTSTSPAATPATVVNASQQNLPWPAYTPGAAPSMLVGLGWKQDDWSSAPTTAAWTSEMGQIAATAGDDAGHVWWLQARTDTTQKPAGFWTVTGGAAAISKAALVAFGRRPNVGVETSVITPLLDSVWVKNVRRPSLNRKLTVTGISDITRPARVSVVDVIGRTLPVAINDVRGSQRLTLSVTVPSLAAAADFDNALLTGHTVFIQAPELACAVPTLYATIGDTTQRKTSARGVRRYFDLPLTEVAAPASTVYSDTFVYADVLATYATIADVVAANASYSALVDKVSSAVVIVP